MHYCQRTHGAHGKSLGLQVRGGTESSIVFPDEHRHNLRFSSRPSALAIASIVKTPAKQAGSFAMNPAILPSALSLAKTLSLRVRPGCVDPSTLKCCNTATCTCPGASPARQDISRNGAERLPRLLVGASCRSNEREASTRRKVRRSLTEAERNLTRVPGANDGRSS